MSSNSPGDSTQSQTTSAPSVQAIPDDSIDLRVYINVMLSWWKEILLIALLCGLVGGGGHWLLQRSGEPRYASSAAAAIIRTISEVTLDERFTTISENPSASAAVSRRNALVALAESPALATAVIEELGESIPEDLREPSRLARLVVAEMATANGRTGDSDLIRITATTNSPEVSTLIATAWTRAFVQNVNQIYGQVPDALFDSIAIEQETSRINYESAQQAYEEFLAQSNVDELTRIISDRETVINVLRSGRNDLLNGLVTSAVDSRNEVASAVSDAQAQNLSTPIVVEQEGKRDLVEAYVKSIYDGQVQVVQEQAGRDQQMLKGYYTRWLQVSQALDQATALRTQTQAIADSTGTANSAETDGEAGQLGSGSSALVLSLLKLQAFTGALDTPVTQDLAVDSPSDVTVNAAAAEAQAAAAPGLVQSSQPVQVQVGATPLQIQLSDVATMTNAQILAELDAMVTTLAQRRDELQTSIDSLAQTMLDGSTFQIPKISPNENAVALNLPALVDSILGSSIITTTSAALQAASTWDVGELANLYNTSDLQALALAQSSGNDALLDTITAAEAELRTLKADLEAERTTQLELTQARDLAQDAFRSADRKKTELTLARAGAGGEVRFAAPAVAPVTPITGINPLLVFIAATMAGFVLGVIVAFIADAMGQPPFLSRRSSRQKQSLAASIISEVIKSPHEGHYSCRRTRHTSLSADNFG